MFPGGLGFVQKVKREEREKPERTID